MGGLWQDWIGLRKINVVFIPSENCGAVFTMACDKDTNVFFFLKNIYLEDTFIQM